MNATVATEPGFVLSLGERPLSIEDVVRYSNGTTALVLAPAAAVALEHNAQAFQRLLSSGAEIYGVTTGYGDSASVRIAAELRAQLAQNLVRYHGCGVGPVLSPAQCRAVVLCRLACLVQAHSGVRPLVVSRLIDLLNAGLVPAIPALGSVGASGDLTPLSYVAAALLGEREVHGTLGPEPIAPHLQRLGFTPLALEPKESLALMNGTSAMTALACLAFDRARRLTRWCAALTALCCDAVAGQPAHFAERLFELKPHAGQQHAARWLRADLQRPAPDPEQHSGFALGFGTPSAAPRAATAPLQDRYSLRCAPHVIGVCLDLLPPVRLWLETELNSVNDNPVLDADTLYHGGHFYGGHVCLAMDALKTAVANLADLLDRQLLLVGDARISGLPSNLVASADQVAHHGFKAMQIAASALSAEAAKLCMPASVFSRSTENHNQDKVSMGTIAARDCLQVLQLSESVAAIATVTLVQAVELRGLQHCGERSRLLHAAVRAQVPFNSADRRMDQDIQLVLQAQQAGSLPLGEADFG